MRHPGEDERLVGAPLVGDFDGDGVQEAFFIAGKGTSDKTKKANSGRGCCLKLGPGQGNARRTGTSG